MLCYNKDWNIFLNRLRTEPSSEAQKFIILFKWKLRRNYFSLFIVCQYFFNKTKNIHFSAILSNVSILFCYILTIQNMSLFCYILSIRKVLIQFTLHSAHHSLQSLQLAFKSITLFKIIIKIVNNERTQTLLR